VNRLPTWATWSIAVAVVLSPALAFLMFIAAEILIDLLMEAGALALIGLAIAVGIGWFLRRRLLRSIEDRLRSEGGQVRDEPAH
jgi:amino acid transporter